MKIIGFYIQTIGGKELHKFIEDPKIDSYSNMPCLAFKRIKKLHVSNNKCGKFLDCSNNDIEELKIPEGLVELWCHNNKIKELILPDSLLYLSCDSNVKILNINNKVTINYLC